MTYNEYQLLAARTIPDIDLNLNLCHMALGIHSEYNEYVDATDKVNIGEELADIMWYVAGYCTLRGYKIFDILDLENIYEYRSLNYFTSRLHNVVKRFVIYKKDPDVAEETIMLFSIIKHIENTFTAKGLNINEWLEKNIEKLKVRYPEKFSEEAALNRDLEAERKELEK